MAKWREELHPRDPADGEFIGKGGGWLRRLGARIGGSDEYKPGTDITDEVARDYHKKYDLGRGTPGQGDLELQAITKRQGWHAPARVGTKEELDQAVAAGGTEIFRGLHNESITKVQQWMRDAATGPDPRYGFGIYTNGNYTTVEREALTRGGSLGYASGEHAIQRMVLMPHARVLDWKSDEYSEMQRRAYAAGEQNGATLYGASAAAAAGYDAIRIPAGHNDGTGRDAEQYVLLNRTAALFEELGEAPHPLDLVDEPELNGPAVPEDMRGAKGISVWDYDEELRKATEYWDQINNRWAIMSDSGMAQWSRNHGPNDRVFVRKRR